MPRRPAAVLYAPDTDVDALLCAFAERLRARGVRLGGVVQHNVRSCDDCPTEMDLIDLMSGARYPLCQSLGSGSESCRLDPDGLAQAAMGVRRAVEAGVELLIVNKFAAREADGGGLREEMALAVLAGLPLLTAVGERFAGDWQCFTGGDTTLLAPDLEKLERWWS